jgi:hypothetical protein
MGLAGIAALKRYSWGVSVDGTIGFDYQTADNQSRVDFDIANSLACEIDPRDEHRVMADAWELATTLILDDDVWQAIEWLAGIIEGVELDGVAVMRIVDGELAERVAENP